MSLRIFLPPDVAAGKQVVLVNGRCYERVGPSSVDPDTFSVDDEFESCEACEGSSTSGSDGSDSGPSSQSDDSYSGGGSGSLASSTAP